jgi:phosphopantothenoylcysteine decarboxylase / phosphopantothenate---cysteine ligase
MLQGKKIIIGITGSIAAYKTTFLVRFLKKEGAVVQVIMTESAHDFVTPLTFSALSERPVLTEAFDKKDGTWNSHVELGNWADLFVIAPASANTISKMASGAADNLLSCTYLAAKSPVMLAPAMDLDMYKHMQTQKNIKTLSSKGDIIVKPASGELASGLVGCGRMEEPENILKFIVDFFQKKKS